MELEWTFFPIKQSVPSVEKSASNRMFQIILVSNEGEAPYWKPIQFVGQVKRGLTINVPEPMYVRVRRPPNTTYDL